MRNQKLSMLAMVAIVLFSLASCVKNEVSEGIETLRKAQAGLIEARAAYQTAQIAYLNALTAQQEELAAQAVITTALSQLSLDQKTATRETDIAAALAVAEQNYIYKMTILATAEGNYAKALEDLDEKLAEVGSQNAAAYLKEYTAAIDTVHGQMKLIYNQEKIVAEKRVDTASANLGLAIVGYQFQLERKLTEESREETKLENLEAALNSPQSISDSIASYEATIAELANDSLSLTTNLQEKQGEIDAKDAEMKAASEDSTTLADKVGELEQMETDSTKAQDDLADLNDELVAENDTLAMINEDIADAKADSVAVQADIALVQPSYDAHKADSTSTWNQFATDTANYIVQKANYDNKFTVTKIEKDKLTERYTNGEILNASDSAAYRTALAASDAQAIVLYNADSVQNRSKGLYVIANDSYETFKTNTWEPLMTNLENATEAIQTEMDKISPQEDEIAEVEEKIAEKEADIVAFGEKLVLMRNEVARVKAAGEAGAALYYQLIDEMNQLAYEKMLIQASLNDVLNMIAMYEGLVATLEAGQTAIENAIKGSQMALYGDPADDDVNGIKGEIADLEDKIAKEPAKNEILRDLVDAVAELEKLQAGLVALEADAAYWKALLDAELNG